MFRGHFAERELLIRDTPDHVEAEAELAQRPHEGRPGNGVLSCLPPRESQVPPE